MPVFHTPWKEKKEKSESKTGPMVVQYVLAPILTAFIGFYFGQLGEQRKQVGADVQSFRDYRMKVFIATAGNFSDYVSSWSQLVLIANYEMKGKLNTEETARKAGYVIKRDEAGRQLGGDFSQAKVFFSKDVAVLIDEYRDFDAAQRIKYVDELSRDKAVEKWTDYQGRILNAMKNELGIPAAEPKGAK